MEIITVSYYALRRQVIINKEFLEEWECKNNYYLNYLVNNVSVSFYLYERCMIGSKLLSKQAISERIVNENDRIILDVNIYNQVYLYMWCKNILYAKTIMQDTPIYVETTKDEISDKILFIWWNCWQKYFNSVDI